MIDWKQRKLAGYPLITCTMFAVLQRLLDAKQAGNPWLALGDVHGATLNALQRKDWVVHSRGLDGVRYKITGRGEKVHRVYSYPINDRRHFDGLCPNCRQRPKHTYSTGRKAGYCQECDREITRKQNRRSRQHNGKDRLCPTCKRHPRYVTKSGYVRSYCRQCRHERDRKERKRAQERLWARLESGEVLLCYGCHEQPRHITANTIQDYCRDCQLEKQRTSHRRRRKKQRELST